MSRMLTSQSLSRAVAVTLATAALSVVLTAQRGQEPSVTPQELGRIWDAEHVSPPLPPLMDHTEVVQRLKAVVSASPDLFQARRGRRIARGPCHP